MDWQSLTEELARRIEQSQNCIIHAGIDMVQPEPNNDHPFIYRAISEMANYGHVNLVINANSNGMFIRAGISPRYISHIYGDQNLTVCESCSANYINWQSNSEHYPQESNIVCVFCNEKTRYTKLPENYPISKFELEVIKRNHLNADLVIMLGIPIIIEKQFFILKNTRLAKLSERSKKLKNLFVINEYPTPINRYAEFVIKQNCETVFEKLSDLLFIRSPFTFPAITFNDVNYFRYPSYRYSPMKNNYYARALMNYQFNKFTVNQFIDTEIESKVAEMANHLQKRNCVIIAGAGISTAAGIPDFRGPNGLVTKKFRGEEFNLSKIKPFNRIVPTISHRAIAKLAKLDYVSNIISFNVDGLFLRMNVNFQKLYFAHGNCYIYNCDCKKSFIGSKPTSTICCKETDYTCPSCKNFKLKDSILDWDQELDSNWNWALEQVKAAEMILCIGTSFKQKHIADLVKCAKGKNIPIFIINLQKTSLDKLAHCCFYEYCDIVLQDLMEKLNINVPKYNPFEDPTKTGEDFIEFKLEVRQI